MGIKRDRILNIVLGFLILSSFVLSYSLWTAGRNIGEEATSSGQMARTNVSFTEHSESDTFRPTSVVLHGVSTEHQIVMSNTYPLRNLLRERHDLRNINRIERSSSRSYENYIQELQFGRWIEFIYTEERPIGLLEQKFEQLSRDAGNNFYDRVMVNLDTPDIIYFYHTGSRTMYEASVVEDYELDFAPFLNEENLNYVGVFPTLLENNMTYLPNEESEIEQNIYVLDQLPSSAYIGNFFPDTSLVDSRSTGNITRLIDLTKEVSINQNIYTLNFLRQISDTGDLEPTTRFSRSFDQVNRFENWADTFILSSYNREEEKIQFQREMEGYPVFSHNGYESISEVGLVETGVTHLKLPLRFINTPISTGGTPPQKLMAGDELLYFIRSITTEEMFAQIDDMTIGYAWDESDEDSQVVYFNPAWFLSVDGTWMSLDEFTDSHEEVAADGF